MFKPANPKPKALVKKKEALRRQRQGWGIDRGIRHIERRPRAWRRTGWSQDNG
jgi:hypothetical protein